MGRVKVFYRAVKDADRHAVVLVDGYDCLFNPPEMPSMHNSQAGLNLLDYGLREGVDAFDLFDLFSC